MVASEVSSKAASSQAPLRILELGCELCRYTVPEQTDFYWIDRKSQPGVRLLGPVNFGRVLNRLWRGDYDLVVIGVPLLSPWHPRSWLTALRDWHVRAPAALFATFAVRYFHWFHRVPTAAIDLADTFGIRAHNFGLLGHCTAYFKRELPADRWQVFFRSGHWDLPGRRWRMRKRSQRLLSKLRPISLGTGATTATMTMPKTSDVFFAGDVSPSSTVRSDGIDELLALRAEGIVVDVAEQRIPHHEFTERLASAWLAWSPSGYGWDCYRHYESGLLGTVALANYPTTYRYRPLEDGKHCVYYATEPGGLAAAVRAALADKPRLERMAAAAREHVLKHHTTRARIEYVVRVTLGRSLDGARAERE
jgi:Glycosyl transferases group 1